jgi:uncharacterized protein YeeX (DUF496 family)
MIRYHINSQGVPAVCKARPGNCPFGGEESHYNSLEEAQVAANKLAEEKYGIMPGMPKEYVENTDIKEYGILSEYSKLSSETSDNPEDYVDYPRNEFGLIDDESKFEGIKIYYLSNKYNISSEWVNRFLEHKYFDEFVSHYASDVKKDKLFDDQADLYNKTQKLWKDLHYENSSFLIKKLDEQEAVDIVRENMRMNDINGWFREFNSDYKPRIENQIIINPDLRSASLNIAHRVFQESTGKVVPFDVFVNSEIEVYRGGNFDFIENDVFISYSFDRKIAEKFAKGGRVESRLVKIKDTLGSLQTTGEAELMVRNRI